MHADEKQRVAYHESGHALVAYSLPNTDPVHKVSIIPRGLAALGYTMQRPEGDRYLMTQSELESRIQVLLAGTVAEEMIFDDVSTGAQNDLERASEIARSMVMDYGMSRLGRVNYRESAPLAVPGRRRRFPARAQPQRADGPRDRRGSPADHRRIAREGAAHPRNPAPALEALAARLIEKEVIDTDELKQIIEENSPSPHDRARHRHRAKAIRTLRDEEARPKPIRPAGRRGTHRANFWGGDVHSPPRIGGQIAPHNLLAPEAQGVNTVVLDSAMERTTVDRPEARHQFPPPRVLSNSPP